MVRLETQLDALEAILGRGDAGNADEAPSVRRVVGARASRRICARGSSRTSRALSETSVGRSRIHPRFGKQSIGEMLELFLAHEGHHLYQVMLRLADARSG
jgi:hypothetical protein